MRLRTLQEKWLGPLGLQWWHRIEFIYLEDRTVFQGGETIGEGQIIESVMIVTTDWARLWAEIEVNLPLVATLSDEELEHSFLHEMCHIMVSPMKGREDHLEDLEELVVTRLAMAFEWVEKLMREE